MKAFCAAIPFAAIAAAAAPVWGAPVLPAVDATLKIGSAYVNGEQYVCAKSSAANTVNCTCSSTGTSWGTAPTVTPTPTFYPNSGVYLLPTNVNTTDVTQVFHVGLNGGTHLDEILNYHAWHVATDCYLNLPTTYTYCRSRTCLNRMGPRLAVVEDTGTQTAGVFFVVPSTANMLTGHIMVLDIAASGTGAGTFTDISGALGTTYDSGAPPIAADITAYTGHPFAATRLSDQRNVGVVYFDGVSWHAIDTAGNAAQLPPGTTIGNSIAISATPAIIDSTRGITGYEWILFPASDGHVYETRIIVDSTTTVVSLDKFVDLGAVTSSGADYTSDSIAATWYGSGSAAAQVVYVRVPSAIGSLFTADASAFDGTLSPAGWQYVSLTGDSYAGFESAIQFASGASETNEVLGICVHNNVNDVCEMTRTAGNTNWSWAYP